MTPTLNDKNQTLFLITMLHNKIALIFPNTDRRLHIADREIWKMKHQT